MTIALTIFILSGLGIILLLSLKMYQDSRDVLLFWPQLRNRVEIKLKGVERSLTKIQHISTKTFYVLLHRFLNKCREYALRLEQKLDKKSRNLLSLIRGRQELQKRGKASVFLHDMTNFRRHSKKE